MRVFENLTLELLDRVKGNLALALDFVGWRIRGCFG